MDEATKQQLAAILQVQGAVFIRELFRDLGIPHSGTKDELRSRAETALEDGTLTEARVRDWMAAVEGWGDQTVQLRRVRDGHSLSDGYGEDDLEAALSGTDFGSLVGQPDALEFPADLTPARAVLRHGRVGLTWQARADKPKRASAKDRRRTIDGDLYEFRAYRHVPERHTVRLQIEIATGLCAVFNSVPDKSALDPTPVIEQAWLLAETILATAPVAVDLDGAIRKLSDGNSPTLAARGRRMEGGGARIDLTATTASDYRDSPEVSQVAQTASGVAGLTNRRGIFNHAVAAARPRTVVIRLNQAEDTLSVQAQMDEEQMWNLLHMVADAATP